MSYRGGRDVLPRNRFLFYTVAVFMLFSVLCFIPARADEVASEPEPVESVSGPDLVEADPEPEPADAASEPDLVEADPEPEPEVLDEIIPEETVVYTGQIARLETLLWVVIIALGFNAGVSLVLMVGRYLPHGN